MDFRKKVVLITGASAGIGKQLAIELARRGATIVGCGRSHERLQGALSELKSLSPASSMHACDVGSHEQVREMIRKVLGDLGQIDVLVNNAGIGFYRNFADSSVDSIEAVARTNFYGAIYCIKEVLPSMIERRSGHIVNVASLAGKIGTPNMAPYCASKFALVGLSESLYHELRPLGIHVSLICPGAVRTEMPLFLEEVAAGVWIPEFALLEPAGVSRAIIRAIEKKRFEVILPFWFTLVCGVKALVPNIFHRASHHVLRFRAKPRGKL